MSTGVLLGFGCVRACVTGVSCFPGSCPMSVAGGRAGQGPGGAWPPGAAPEASLRWPGGSPMMGAAGNGSRGGAGYLSLLSGPSHGEGLAVRAVPLAAVIPSRVPGRCRGRMGRVRVRKERSGGVNQDGARAAGWRAVGQTQEATSRLAAGQEELFMPPARAAGSPAGWREIGAGSGSARRACRSRPG